MNIKTPGFGLWIIERSLFMCIALVSADGFLNEVHVYSCVASMLVSSMYKVFLFCFHIQIFIGTTGAGI